MSAFEELTEPSFDESQLNYQRRLEKAGYTFDQVCRALNNRREARIKLVSKPVALAIVGGRNFDDYRMLERTIDDLRKRCNVTLIVSGGARGADSLARRYAVEKGVKPLEFIPKWEKYGKAAGFKRNGKIVRASNRVVAFWDGRSNGTRDTITKARAEGKIVDIVYF